MRDALEITISGLGSAGDGVGRLADGQVVFVPRALPGDRVRVRLGQKRKQLQFAELIAVLSPSPDRVESLCPTHACGGCGLKELSIAAQADIKRRRIVETMRRIGRLDIDAMLGPIRQSSPGWRTRHRVRLHAAWSAGQWHLGYFAQRSRTLIALDQCPILWPELEQAALALGDSLGSLPAAAQLEEVEIAFSRCDGRAAAQLVGAGPMAAYQRWLGDGVPGGLAGMAIVANDGSVQHGNLGLRYDHRRAGEFDLQFEPGVFTQANPEMNDELVAAVLAALAPSHSKRVVELHSGIGNFSVPLRLAGIDGVTVERDAHAAALCRQNGSHAGVCLDVRAESDSEVVGNLEDFHAVLLDPPRTGAHEAVAAIASRRSVERVVYVSCDVATLARDAGLLTAAGFAIVAAAAFDMFPQTPHVETLLVFARPPA